MDSQQNLDIEKLIQIEGQPCVSIYLSGSQSPTDAKEPAIKLKNAIRECEKRLGERGLDSEEIEGIVAPVRRLIEGNPIIGQSDQKLVIFSCRDLFRHHRLPVKATEQIMVAERFYVKPLVPLLAFDETFYVLSLSLNEIKLYEAARQHFQMKPMENAPESIDDLLQYEEVQKQIQSHTMPKGKSAGSSAIFHGHGNVADATKHKKDITQFLSAVDNGLMEVLSGRKNPLILAGVDYIRAAYAGLSDYPNILAEGIDGNPEQLTENELHRAAWNIIEPVLAKEVEDAIERYGDSSSTNLTSTNLREILSAAYQGRVAALLVDGRRCVWGRFDSDSNQIHIHQEPEPMDEDLLNLAVIQVLKGKGKFYMPSTEQMPEGAAQAAIFRY